MMVMRVVWLIKQGYDVVIPLFYGALCLWLHACQMLRDTACVWITLLDPCPHP